MVMAGKISKEARERYNVARILWILAFAMVASLFVTGGDGFVWLTRITLTIVLAVSGVIFYADGNRLNKSKASLAKKLRGMRIATRICWVVAALVALPIIHSFMLRTHAAMDKAFVLLFIGIMLEVPSLILAISLTVITHKLKKRVAPAKPATKTKKKPHAEYTDDSF